MMIKLANSCYVAADRIQGIKSAFEFGRITIRMKDGTDHTIDCDCDKSIDETIARLVDEINTACSGVPA